MIVEPLNTFSDSIIINGKPDLNLGCPQEHARDGHFGAYLLGQSDWPLVEKIGMRSCKGSGKSRSDVLRSIFYVKVVRGTCLCEIAFVSAQCEDCGTFTKTGGLWSFVGNTPRTDSICSEAATRSRRFECG